ncbi:hypothetical protein V1525DRAFT_138210 [Lipomyces kononenkoae]|uniref:Uncharacterized protein n=1 Tax=Lipomyces kononenkoae TaxID=34357 RepID=A0ACC3SQ29_LIPKO
MTQYNRLKQYLPWVQTPVIINAPMSGFATSELAVAVTRAGGLGQIGFLNDKHMLGLELEKARRQLQGFIISSGQQETLPVGVGVIVFGSAWGDWLPLFSKYKPAVVWLSFGETEEFQQWTEGIRKSSPHTKVWVQLGSVRAALDTARVCRPDALVLQGSDAGGHGHAHGASVISLIPEVADTLQGNGIQDIPLIAAGGIMDGRGAAAAVVLGAAGVVMGTRFLAAEETRLPSEYREAILVASDGGQSTVRSRLFDEIWGPSPWPETYDGRCLRNAYYEDLTMGMPIPEVRTKFYSRLRRGQEGQLDTPDQPSVWAGTGVGLVKKMDKAADIVQEVQIDARKRLENGLSGLHTGMEV